MNHPVSKEGKANALRLARQPRNDKFVDWWSATHFTWGVILTLVLGPGWAFAVLVAWEPLEILVVGPLLARFGITFGHETVRNSMSDIVFDAVGVAAGYLIAWAIWDPFGIV